MISAAIDIGGTKTHIRIIDKDRLLADRIITTADWRKRSTPLRELSDIILGLAADLPQIVVVGAHGCDTDDECSELASRLSCLLAADILVLNDAELLLAASGHLAGISVISGTGSIAVSRDRNRRLISAGGWGWYLGDEGSASGIVREAARAVRNAVDRGESDDPLVSALCDTFGARRDASDLGSCLSRLGSAAAIGAGSHVVFNALHQGSKLASSVIAEGAAELARKVAILIDRGADGGHIVTGGGVFTSQTVLFDIFQREVKRIAPAWTIQALSVPPVSGAVALAHRIMNGQDIGRLPAPLRKRIHGEAR